MGRCTYHRAKKVKRNFICFASVPKKVERKKINFSRTNRNCQSNPPRELAYCDCRSMMVSLERPLQARLLHLLTLYLCSFLLAYAPSLPIRVCILAPSCLNTVFSCLSPARLRPFDCSFCPPFTCLPLSLIFLHRGLCQIGRKRRHAVSAQQQQQQNNRTTTTKKSIIYL